MNRFYITEKWETGATISDKSEIYDWYKFVAIILLLENYITIKLKFKYVREKTI